VRGTGKENLCIDRRHFLCAAAAGCGLVSGLALSACATVPTLHAAVHAGRVRLSRTDLDTAFDGGNALLLRADALPEDIYLVRDDANEPLAAIGGTCTHLGCQVRPANTFFRCPCHGSTFTLDGDVVRGPASKPLSRYPLSVVDDYFEIELP
jgi:Rieske Fe-S protein